MIIIIIIIDIDNGHNKYQPSTLNDFPVIYLLEFAEG